MKGTRREKIRRKKGALKEINKPYAEYNSYFGFHGTVKIDPKSPCHISIYIYKIIIYIIFISKYFSIFVYF